ncbi:MAG: phosphate/phosphite/phosphonate ABC transporter substrate-binding protein, partial [Betaproteobacteria bacterium]
MNALKTPLAAISLLLVFALCGGRVASAQGKSHPATGASKEIAFGMISATGNEDYKKRWRPLLDELGARTGHHVTATAAPNIVDDIRDGKIQIAWLSNKLALDAIATGKMKIFAQMMKSDGSSGYSSVLIVGRDSPLTSAEDMFKKPGVLKLGYGDPNSTTGYLVPNIFLFKKANIDPAKHFKSIVAQGPRANFLAVVNRQVDVAVNNTEDMAIFRKEFPDKFKDIRVIWTSQ